jgi:hypothetical protein
MKYIKDCPTFKTLLKKNWVPGKCCEDVM